MAPAHSEECAWIRVIQHELYVFGFPFVIVGVMDWRSDAKSPVGTILYERRSGVGVVLEVVDEVLVSSVDDDQWGW